MPINNCQNQKDTNCIRKQGNQWVKAIFGVEFWFLTHPVIEGYSHVDQYRIYKVNCAHKTEVYSI